MDMPSLADLGPWTWWIVATVLAIIELVVPGIFFIWLAAAAAAVGVILLVVGLPVIVQVALFAGLSVLAVWSSRRWLGRHPIESDQPLLNQRAATYIGRTVTLEQPIRNGRGKVRIGDTLWLAQGPDLPEGATVRVTGADGVSLIVEAA